MKFRDRVRVEQRTSSSQGSVSSLVRKTANSVSSLTPLPGRIGAAAQQPHIGDFVWFSIA